MCAFSSPSVLQLIDLDPTCRMSARTAGEHAWLGGKEVAALRREQVVAKTKERHEAQEAESKERALFLRWILCKAFKN